ASTIINEVTGTSRSQIYGPQEILGKSADYILANPNGISINGGEFINTQSAIYTSGKVLLDSSGQLEKFLIEKGEVEIDGVDLDLSNLDYFEIIARSVKLNTAIYAKRNRALEDSQDTELSVVAGTGEYNVKSKKLNPKRSDTSVPSLAIDTSKLGGLYAGKIRLVSSEAGVGVNFPDIQSTTGDIEITADGKITHKNISSANKLKVVSTNGKIIASSSKESIAQGDTQYIAKKGIEVESGSAIASQGSVQLESADGEIKNQGIIVSQGKRGISLDAMGIKNNGILLTDSGTLGNISINSKGAIENNGIIKTDLALTNTFQTDFHNTGKINSKTSRYRGTNFKNSKNAEIYTQDASSVFLSGNFTNAGSIITENFGIESASGKLVNSGLIESKKVNLSGSEFENTLGAEMHIQEKAILSLDNNFANTGSVYSSELQVISKSGNIANSGTILSSNGGSFDAYLDFTNTGNIEIITALLQVTSKTQRLINSGKISAPKMSITSRGDIENSDTILTSLLDITSTHGGLLNSGTIKSLGKATIDLADDFSNEDGLLFTAKNLVLNTGGNLLNDSESGIVSKRGILLKASGKIENKGHIEAKKSVSADTGSTLDNSGSIYSDRNIVLSSMQAFVNSVSGVIKSIGLQEITSKSAELNNQGKIESKTDSVTLTAHDDLENSGSIIAHQNITSIGSENINNSGSILTSKDMKLETSGKFINSIGANIGSGKNLTLLAEDDIDNAGEILALNGTASIKSGENIINREGGSISSELGSEIIADNDIVNNGTVISENNIDIKAEEDIHNGAKGQVRSEKKVTILSETQSITNDGVIGATSDVSLRAEKSIENNGGILSYRTTDIIGHSVINNGQINSVKSTKLLAESSIENKGHTLSGGTIEIDGKSIANLGQINSKQSTKLLAVDDIDNVDSGLIKSGGNLTITSTKGHIKNVNSDPARFSKSGIVAAEKSTIEAALGFENTKAHLEFGKSLEI
ncbi:MAG: filamentous hemagglutinin N-terminal domain-containing protein, partial [Pseudomonadota bacterium]